MAIFSILIISNMTPISNSKPFFPADVSKLSDLRLPKTTVAQAITPNGKPNRCDESLQQVKDALIELAQTMKSLDNSGLTMAQFSQASLRALEKVKAALKNAEDKCGGDKRQLAMIKHELAENQNQIDMAQFLPRQKVNGRLTLPGSHAHPTTVLGANNHLIRYATESLRNLNPSPPLQWPALGVPDFTHPPGLPNLMPHFQEAK